MNMRTDPTTARRLLEARRRMTPLVDHTSSLIERALREVDIDAESLKQAARATYVKACEVVADAGLEIRQRALKYTVTNVPGRDAGLRIDVEFALALGQAAAADRGQRAPDRRVRGGAGSPR